MKLLYKTTHHALIALFLIVAHHTTYALEWGFAERQGKRPAMEDAHATPKNGDFIFAIFDGHAGKFAAQYAARKLTVDKKYYSLSDISQWINDEERFLSTKLKTSTHAMTSGTTMISAYINPEKTKANLYWVGDSRGIVIRDGKVIAKTTDHSTKNFKESMRVQDAGAKITGTLIHKKGDASDYRGMTRAIGDLNFKKGVPALISTPEMIEVNIQPKDYIVIACDGLWDVMTNEDVAQYITKNPTPTTVDDKTLSKTGIKKEDPASLKPTAFADMPLSTGTRELRGLGQAVSSAAVDYSISEKFKEKEIASTDKDEELASSSGDLKAIAQSLRDKAFEKGSSDNISVIVVKI